MIRLFHLACLAVMLALFGSAWAAPAEVKVAAYEFPPYFQQGEGVVARFIAQLNRYQKDYKFVLQPIPREQRFKALEAAEADLVLFEDAKWGWSGRSVEVLPELVKDAQVIIAQKAEGRGQEYFKDLPSRKIAAVTGVPYALTGGDAGAADPKLAITWVKGPFDVIDKVVNGEAEVGFVPASYLRRRQNADPTLLDKLMTAEQKELEYSLGAVFSKKSPISTEQFAQLVTRLKGIGVWNFFFRAESF